MKGYYTQVGYMGYIPDKGYGHQGVYILFSCEQDYQEYYKEAIYGNQGN